MTAIERAEAERFGAEIVRLMGIRFEEDKLDFLAGVLSERMDATGCRRPGEYLDRLANGGSREELHALAAHLTVAETYFFRNPAHFDAFVEAALPDRIQARSGERRLRLLSAGCATGEEPYTMAILLRERFPELQSWELQIQGADINPLVLAKAAAGQYSAWSLRSTPDAVRLKYFSGTGRSLALAPEIREMVSFEACNLAACELPAPGRDYDVIFCCNLLMYFAPDVAARTVARLTAALAPGGYLFLGHAETLRGLSQDYHLCHTHETFYYKVKAGAAPLSVPAPASAPPLLSETWMDTIKGASDRIAVLASRHGAAAPAEPPPPLERARELFGQERFADALTLLSPNRDAESLLLLAALHTNSGNLKAAEEICEQLLSRQELDAGVHYLMALCREHRGDLEGAREHDDAAIYLDPDFAMPHLHLGLLARRAGDLETARRELSSAMSLLAREEAARVLLFGGGFGREALLGLCRAQLEACGGEA